VKEKDISNLLIASLVMAACILWPKKTARDDSRNATVVSNEIHNEAQPNEHEAVERRYWKRQNQFVGTSKN
jgi:hypothetical protein